MIVAIAVAIGSYSILVALWISDNLKTSNILQIDIYNPDNSGGLSWIFKPFINLLYVCLPLYLIGFGMVVYYIIILETNWKNPLVLFNLLWPTLFGPLWVYWTVKSTGIHHYLLKQREKLLGEMSYSISNLLKYTKVSQDDYHDSSEMLGFNVKKVTELINLYNQSLMQKS